jgi:Uma2 family endonuclease
MLCSKRSCATRSRTRRTTFVPSHAASTKSSSVSAGSRTSGSSSSKALDDLSEPEPDLAIVPLGKYRTEHPKRALLVIEVADSTLSKDRRLKSRLYAAARIPEYWLVDVAARAIDVFTEPTPEGYASTRRVTDGALEIAALPGVSIDLGPIFPDG